MEDVTERLRATVIDSLGSVGECEVISSARFVEDMGADSLDAVELVMKVEDEFCIEIPDEDAEKITTFGEAVEYVNGRMRC